jgi:hypothetical protein
MPSPDEPKEVTPKRELCRRRLKCIEMLLPQVLDTAEQKGRYNCGSSWAAMSA